MLGQFKEKLIAVQVVGKNANLKWNHRLDDEAFGYLERVIVTPAVYPRFIEFLHFDIQSTGQKSHRINIAFAMLCFILFYFFFLSPWNVSFFF